MRISDWSSDLCSSDLHIVPLFLSTNSDSASVLDLPCGCPLGRGSGATCTSSRRSDAPSVQRADQPLSLTRSHPDGAGIASPRQPTKRLLGLGRVQGPEARRVGKEGSGKRTPVG